MGLELPNELNRYLYELVENKEQLELSGIFEDLIQKALKELGLENYLEEQYKDLISGKLDDWQKLQLKSNLITKQEFYKNDPLYVEMRKKLEID